MNPAHIHILINHLPVTGIFFGALILIIALIRKNAYLKRFSLGFIIFTSLLCIPAYLTGEGAEEVVEEFSGVDHQLIHEHEEIAETTFILVLVNAGIALMGLLLASKNEELLYKASIIVLISSLVCIGFLMRTAFTGGTIRHPEMQNSEPKADTLAVNH